MRNGSIFIAAFVCSAVIFVLGLWMVSGDSLDFIERHLGFSPDRGDGSVEALVLLTTVGVIAGLALRLPAKLKPSDLD